MTSSGYMNKSKTDSWGTPPYILEDLAEKCGELSSYDPCPLNDQPETNGLEQNWTDHETQGRPIFVNPPFSDLKSTKKRGIGWIEKMYESSKSGQKIIGLFPARTDTEVFHDFVFKHGRVEFLRGRIRFINTTTGEPLGPAPFGCVYWFLNC